MCAYSGKIYGGINDIHLMRSAKLTYSRSSESKIMLSILFNGAKLFPKDISFIIYNGNDIITRFIYFRVGYRPFHAFFDLHFVAIESGKVVFFNSFGDTQFVFCRCRIGVVMVVNNTDVICFCIPFHL